MPQLAYDLVVVPLDFSEASQNALAAAVEMAGDSKKVHAVHVLPPLEAMSPGVANPRRSRALLHAQSI